jgi:hypothetical protein
MLKNFYGTWIIYWLMVLALPVRSIYPAVLPAFVLQLSFVILVTIGYFALPVICRFDASPTINAGEISNADKLIRVSFLLSLLGFSFLFFDKIYIQHINYLNGLAVAREQWREAGEERQGQASSIWSALGYLLGSAYYVGLVLTVTQASLLRTGQRLRAMMIAFLFALGNSIITGGRSNFLLLGVVGLAGLSSRRSLRLGGVFRSSAQRRFFAAGAVFSISYIVYVFYSRAEAGNQLISAYVAGVLPDLGLESNGWYGFDEHSEGALANVFVLVVSYLTHSFATVAAIMDAPQEDKTIIFSNLALLLYKLHILGKPDDVWFLNGRFPSVPGALWHQFGAFGFVLGSMALGVASGAVKVWAAVAAHRLLPLGALVLVSATLILSPYVFAPDILSFPYIAFAFVVIAGCAYLFRRARFRESRATRR